MAGPWEKYAAPDGPWSKFGGSSDEPTKPTEGGFAPRVAREGMPVNRKEAMKEQIRAERANGSNPITNTLNTASNRLGTAWRSAVGAIPFGDDVVAGLATAVPSDLDYSLPSEERFARNRDYVEAQHAVDMEKEPVSSVVGTVGGLLAGPGAGFIARGSGALGVAGRSGLVGAGYGAADGLGSNGTIEQRMERGKSGTALGAAFGAGFPLAARGVGAVAGEFARPFSTRLGYRMNPDAAVDRAVAGAWRADQDIGRILSPDDLATAERFGMPVNIGDVGGDTTRALGRAAANASPVARGIMENTLDPRYQGQQGRLSQLIGNLFDIPSPAALQARIDEAERLVNRRAYRELYNEHPMVWNDRLMELLRVPEVARAADDVMARQPARRAAGMSSGPMSRDIPNVEFWDRVQRELRDRANGASGERAQEMSALYGALRQQIVGEVDRLTGGRFSEVRAGAARFFGAENALEAGQNFFRQNGLNDLEATRRAIAGFSDAERRLFAQGFAAEMSHAAGNARPGQNIPIQSWLSSPNAREKMTLALGEGRAADINSVLNVEAAMNRMRDATKGNSTTLRQMLESGIFGGVGGALAEGSLDPVQAFTNPVGAAIAVARGLASRHKGMSPEMAERLARRLMSNNPADVARLIQQVGRDRGQRGLLRELESVLARAGAQHTEAVTSEQKPKGYAEGGMATEPKTGAQYYGQEEADRQELEKLSPFGPREVAAPAATYPGDELQERYKDKLPLGVMVPRNAVEIVERDDGAVPVDIEGRQLSWVKRPGMIPVAKDETGSYPVMPVLPDLLGNIAGGGTEGAGMMITSGFRLPGKGGKGAKAADAAAETGKTAKPSKGIAAGDEAVDAEHSMQVERDERFTTNPRNIRLTEAEKALVNSVESPAEQAMLASEIREQRARHPVSDGWAPMTAVGVVRDEKTGVPSVKWKAESYGFNRGDFDVERPVLDADGNKVRQPKLGPDGQPLLDETGAPILTNHVQKETVRENMTPRRGSPEYEKLAKTMTRNGIKAIEEIIARAEAGDEAAKVILRQAGWYRETMRKGFDERGGAYPAFSDLLGGTSPNTSVDQNYAYSVDLQKRFSRGDFDDDVAFTRDYQGSLNAFPGERLLRRNDAFDENGVAKQYGMNSRNAAMALADRWREPVKDQAPKARNFSGNLGGQTDDATIDVWAARFLNRMAGRKRLPPKLESGVGGSLGADLTPGGEFGFGQDVFRRMSQELNKKGNLLPYLKDLGYSNVTPMDLQALTWFIEKELWGKKGWTTKAGEGGSFEDEMRKFPTQRWQSGFSIQQAEPPTDDAMLVARKAVEAPLKDDDAVRVFRVNPTYGRYAGTNERSFDVELSAKPGWDPRRWMASVIDQAKQNNQYDVFFSRRLSPTEAVSNPNARPGVEIYFKSRQEMEKIFPLLEEFTNRGADGFTFVTDLKLRERLAGGKDVPDYVGVRLQFVPEITARWDEAARAAWVKDPAALKQALDDARARMQDAVEAIGKNAEVVDARLHNYDTLAIGKESYDQFLRGIADPDAGAGAARGYEATAGAVDPLARFGQPVSSHVEGRDRALRKGVARGPEDDGGAVSGVVGGDPLTKARGGPVKKPRRETHDLDSFIMATAPRSPGRFAMGGPVFPSAVEPRLTRRGALSYIR